MTRIWGYDVIFQDGLKLSCPFSSEALRNSALNRLLALMIESEQAVKIFCWDVPLRGLA